MTDKFNEEIISLKNNLYEYAFSLTRNRQDAEDLVQNMYVNALRFKKTYKPDAKMKRWLFRIIKNIFINDYRRKRLTLIYGFNEDYLNGIPPADLDKYYLHDKIRNKLNKEFCEVLFLRADGFDYQEIANIIGIPIGTVRTRLHRGRIAAKQMLKRLL